MIALALFAVVSVYALVLVGPEMDPNLGILRWLFAALVVVGLLASLVVGKTSGDDLKAFLAQSASMIALVALDSFSMQRGDALTLIGAVFFALQIATAAKYGRELDVNVITFWMFLTVGVMDAIASFATEPPVTAVSWTPELVGTILFLALCCTCLGMLMQNLGLAHVPSSTGSLLLSLESPSGVLFSVLFAGEQLTMRLVAGFALIFTSIVLSETHFSFLLKPYAHVRKRRER